MLGGQVLMSGHVDDENALLKKPSLLVKMRRQIRETKFSKIGQCATVGLKELG